LTLDFVFKLNLLRVDPVQLAILIEVQRTTRPWHVIFHAYLYQPHTHKHTLLRGSMSTCCTACLQATASSVERDSEAEICKFLTEFRQKAANFRTGAQNFNLAQNGKGGVSPKICTLRCNFFDKKISRQPKFWGRSIAALPAAI